MAGPDPHEDDEFPPRRPFGVPPRPPPAEPDEEDETGAPPRTPAGPGRGQPPATRS